MLVLIETLYGWPSTATQVRNVAFRAAEVGIQLGNPAHPHGVNNDECTFTEIKLSCRVGIRVCNDQSVCHRVSHADNSCPVGIEILKGGSMVVDRLIQSGAGSGRVGILFRGGGPNAATLSISNAKLEAGCLLECGGANQVVHVFSYCGNVGPSVLPWRIGPSALVAAQACSFSGPVAELGGLPGRNAVLIIQNSLLAKPASQSIIYKNPHAYAAVEGVFMQWSNADA